jgi:hypothetical protein
VGKKAASHRDAAFFMNRSRAKWNPVRVKKTRQIKDSSQAALLLRDRSSADALSLRKALIVMCGTVRVRPKAVRYSAEAEIVLAP